MTHKLRLLKKLNIWEFNLISILFGMSMLDMCVLKNLVLIRVFKVYQETATPGNS